MAVLETVKAFYRGARPPYAKQAGPINLTSQSRTFELSQPMTASIEVAIEDIEPEWIRAGSCWSIESEFGEPIWAGFSEEEEWEMDADSITIPLVGPLRGLLEVEVDPSIPTRGAAGFIVRGLIEAAQAIATMELKVGHVDPGPVVDMTLGETVADAIISVRENTNLYFKERAEETSRGLEFFLDFGNIRNQTNILLTRAEIIAGLFTRERYAGSLTFMGPASTFENRTISTVVAHRFGPWAVPSPGPGRPIARPIEGIILPAPGRSSGRPVDIIADADIGPAAIIHRVVIDDRIVDTEVAANRRYFDNLKGVNEILVTLDATAPSGQAPMLGDLVGLRVHRWASSFAVDVAEAHVHAIEPHEEDGSRDLVLAIHPNG